VLKIGTSIQGRYLIVRPLGRGGMGTVYQVLDTNLDAIVAIKEAHIGLGDHLQFEREAKLLANLRHSFLPRVTHYFQVVDRQFFVMEFVDGYDLAHHLELRGRPFELGQVLKWAEDLLGVLEYLHSQDPPILHRDIKPANLRLTPTGELFLVDFGLAKGTAGAMSKESAMTSVYGYTLSYAPPEQISGSGTDERSDLYAVAATLIHLLKGQPPPPADLRQQVVDSHGADPLEHFLMTPPTLPRDLESVLRRALSLGRAQRQASATEMRLALRQAELTRLRSEQSRTVFVLDDDRPRIDLVEARLRREGYNVRTALDADIGLSEILSSQPDLLIAKASMTLLDGTDLVSQIRQNRQTKFIPIILLESDQTNTKTLKPKGDEGAIGYITLPKDLDLLLSRAQTLMDFKMYLDSVESVALRKTRA